MKLVKTIYQTHDAHEHVISSSYVAEEFKIRVLRPISQSDNAERFPVLYVTDSDYYFDGIATLSNALQFSGEALRFILVGIGYGSTREAGMLRWRDLATHSIRSRFQEVIEQAAESPLVGKWSDLSKIMQTTDAEQFLRFIRTELVPFIDDLYPTAPGDNNYCGYSLGGTFGLFTLFTQPDTFRRYILGSPGSSYQGHNFAIDLVDAFNRSRAGMNAKAFLSVGELEEFRYGQFDLVTGFYLLVKHIKQLAVPGLDLNVRVFPGESHATAWPLAFTHGVRALLGGPGNVPFWPE